MKRVPISAEEIAQVIAQAKDALEIATTKADVIAAWKAAYMQIGHRALGRILLGTYDAWVARTARAADPGE